MVLERCCGTLGVTRLERGEDGEVLGGGRSYAVGGEAAVEPDQPDFVVVQAIHLVDHRIAETSNDGAMEIAIDGERPVEELWSGMGAYALCDVGEDCRKAPAFKLVSGQGKATDRKTLEREAEAEGILDECDIDVGDLDPTLRDKTNQGLASRRLRASRIGPSEVPTSTASARWETNWPGRSLREKRRCLNRS